MSQNIESKVPKVRNLKIDSSFTSKRINDLVDGHLSRLDSLNVLNIDSVDLKLVTDSTLNLKHLILNIDSNVKSDFYSNSVPKKYAPKSILRNLEIKPKLSGSIISESYGTNFQDPFTRSEAVYSRLYGAPSIQLLGLPFNIDFFYTTEDNSFYNSNYITLDFDIHAFRQQLRQKAEEKVQEQMDAKKKAAQELTDVSKLEQQAKLKLEQEKQKLTQTLEEAKSFISDTSGLKQQALDKAVEQKDKLIDSGKEKLDKQKDSLSTEVTDTLSNLGVYQKGDSIFQQAQVWQDSIEKIKVRVEQYQQHYDELKAKYEKLKEIDKLAKDSLNYLKENYANQDFILAKAKDHPKAQKILKLASKVETFQLGLTNPIFSEYTLNGIPVKGGHTIFEFRETKVQLAIGKTFRSEANTFGLDQPRPDFVRNVVGVSYKHKLGKQEQNSISLSSVTLFDDNTVELPQQNVLHAVDFEGRAGAKVNYSLSLNHSILNKKESENAVITFTNDEGSVSSSFQNFIDHFAIEGETEIKLSKTLNLTSSYKRVSPEYVSLGNPFLRNNFHEVDIKAKTKLFKRKITLTSFYKRLQDNITKLSETTNTMDGYGVSIRTNFRGPLNFQGQHSPYQQGNNNPDTAFRTDNQLAVTTANLIFNKKLGSTMLTSMLTYVNSTIEYNGGELQLNNTMYLSSTNFATGKFNLSVAASRNITGPVVDTLNFWGVRFGITQKSGKKVTYSLNSFLDRYDVGAFRHRSILQASISAIPKTTVTFSAEAGTIQGLYGIRSKDVFGGRVLIKYQL